MLVSLFSIQQLSQHVSGVCGSVCDVRVNSGMLGGQRGRAAGKDIVHNSHLFRISNGDSNGDWCFCGAVCRHNYITVYMYWYSYALMS